jgi:hypothetical protein
VLLLWDYFIYSARAMKSDRRTQLMTKTRAADEVVLRCRADFIFDAQAHGSNSRPIKVLSECMCDFRRPDWESRCNEWNTRLNPYLNLFLCAEHARQLGLLK